HAREGLSIFVVPDSGEQSHVGESPVAVVVIEKTLHRIVGHENVGKAVAIVIGERDPEPFAAGIRDSGLFGHVRKGSVAVVLIQNIGHAFVVIRMTIRPIARSVFSADAVGLEAPIEIASHEKIKLAIVIVVKKSCACAPTARANSRLLSHISEGAIAIVVIQDIAAISGDINILKAVVVIISNRNSHAVIAFTYSVETGALGHVSKRSIRVLMI